MEVSLALVAIIGAIVIVAHGIGFRRGLQVGERRAVRRIGRYR